MALRVSDVRFWVLFAALAMGLLLACSSDSSPAPGGNDAATENMADSMTKG
jgi:hypothetical protein